MNDRNFIAVFLAFFSTVTSMCGEPPRERDNNRVQDGRSGKHFLADKPLKLFSKKQSDVLRLKEQIEQAEQRARNYKYIYSLSTAPLPLSLRGTAKTPFTLEEATNGLNGRGALRAEIQTSLGTIRCTLDDKTAPREVAHFVALARGRNRWFSRRSGKLMSTPFYRDTLIYKVIPKTVFFGGYPPQAGEMLFSRRTPVKAEAVKDKLPLPPYTLAVAEDDAGFALGQDFAITTVEFEETKNVLHAIGRCESTETIGRISGQETTVTGVPFNEIQLINVVISRL